MTPDRAAPDPVDPKNLIADAFRIEGIGDAECRSILVDWAISVEADDPRPLMAALLDRHRDAPTDHPMIALLREGMGTATPPRRRGGRNQRVPPDA
jgi:hypothetical protein